MIIYVKFLTGKMIKFEAEPSDTILNLKKKISESEGIGIPLDQQTLIFVYQNHSYYLEDKRTLFDYDIQNESIILLTFSIIGGGSIDNIKEEEDIDIGFDLNLIKRDELKVNLIYFDLNMTSKENYEYYNKLKVDVVGGFYAIDDIDVLKDYLENIKEKNISFIIISSGTSGKDIINVCNNYKFIKEVIIFCRNIDYNKHYIEEYPNIVKKVFNSMKSVYTYIKSFGKYILCKKEESGYIFSEEEIQMNRQIDQCPVITAKEYDDCYFLVHKAYSFFFKEIGGFFQGFLDKFYKKIIFEEKYYDKVMDGNFELYEILKDLVGIKDNNTFVEKSIRLYTAQSKFAYLINKMKRNFEKGLISFAYYMGPLLYGLNKYIYDNPKFAISKKMTLYRIMKCSKLDFYEYKLNLGHIICFPSLTSTSYEPINFKPTNLAQQLNKNKSNNMINVKIIFDYNYKKGYISPGIIIGQNKGHDSKPLSNYDEKEVILFPFTFCKIKEIYSSEENGMKFQVIKMDIIPRNTYIEYKLKDDYKNRIFFSKLE